MLPRDGLVLHVGGQLSDLREQGRHAPAGPVDQILRVVHGDLLALLFEVAAHPGDQLPVGGLGELDHRRAVEDLGQRLLAPVDLELGGFVDQNHGAVVGDVGEEFGVGGPVLAQGEEVHVVDLDHGALGHHGQGLDAVQHALQGDRLRAEAVVVEGLGKVLHQELVEAVEIVAPQIGLLAVKDVEPRGRVQLEIGFELFQIVVGHGVTVLLLNCRIRRCGRPARRRPRSDPVPPGSAGRSCSGRR